MDFFEQVRKDNVIKYGTRVSSYIPIIINQYSDRTHFIYEILQNAEDAGATYIRFILHKDRFEVFHNGRPFNEKDIIGVCGIADGTKEDGTRIGHFGIGFKAVYGYTSTPEIYSGKYSFRIQDYLNPFEIKQKDDLAPEETCLVLPFDKDSVTKDTAYAEIKEALMRKITAESILMLDSIGEVEKTIDGYPESICISKEKGRKDKSGNVYDLNIMTSYHNGVAHSNREEEQNYLFFTDGEKEACANHYYFLQDGIQNISMTFHSSKGLEFDQVILFAEDYNLYYEDSIYNHYVAATRAKDRLIIVYLGGSKDQNFYRNLSNKISDLNKKTEDFMKILVKSKE